ncbi:transporter substrate-binding domain-containing protein [Actinocorallia aurea]
MALFVLLAALLVVGACQLVRSDVESVQELHVKAGLQGKPRILLGIRDDIPGIALRTADGGYSGFEIDLARAVARELGFRSEEVVLLPIEIESRATMQARVPDELRAVVGNKEFVKVDLVVSSFSITDERKAQGVNFSSAYLTTTQAVLTRPGYTETLQSTADLEGKRVCTTGTSTAIEPLLQVGIIAKARHHISDCVADLKKGDFDAVQTDAAILGGFVHQTPDELEIHDIAIGPPERWGINVGENPAMGRLVELALHDIVADGEWSRLYDEHIAPIQRTVGGHQQIAFADPPRIDRPEVRE